MEPRVGDRVRVDGRTGTVIRLGAPNDGRDGEGSRRWAVVALDLSQARTWVWVADDRWHDFSIAEEQEDVVLLS